MKEYDVPGHIPQYVILCMIYNEVCQSAIN